MASKADAQYLADLFLPDATTAQIEYICTKSPNEFDIETARINLGGESKIDPKKIVASIRRAASQRSAELCERCRNHHIPVFDVDSYTGWDIPTIMHIPTMYIDCPNCGAHKGTILKYWNRLNDEQQALTWLVWYDFANYHLQQSIQPQDFHPSIIWNVNHDQIIISEPALNAAQHQWMKWSHNLSRSRETRPIELKPITEQAKSQMAVPF